ncbi:MAG TPA: hypothetical protein VEN30_08615 [Paraburkholderia sp.]|nr:hypothetical protein [Paraburkholderia sp.]
MTETDITTIELENATTQNPAIASSSAGTAPHPRSSAVTAS